MLGPSTVYVLWVSKINKEMCRVSWDTKTDPWVNIYMDVAVGENQEWKQQSQKG